MLFDKEDFCGKKFLGEKSGTMALFFGCRQPSEHSYKEEVEEALKQGALTHSFTAFSRIPGKPKVCLNFGAKNEMHVASWLK